MDDYGRRVVVDWPFDRAVSEVERVLGAEGVRIVSRVDIGELAPAAHHEFRRYALLYACSPPFIVEALRRDLAFGTVAAATVAVYELADGETAVIAGEPCAAVIEEPEWRAANPELAALADDELARVARAVESLERDTRSITVA